MKCEIAQDLLPNYLEGLTSPVTNEELEEHLKECQICGRICEDMRKEMPIKKEEVHPEEINPLKKIRRKTRIKVGIFGGIALLLLLMIIVILKFTTGNVLGVKIVISESSLYTEAEIKAAMEVVKQDFFWHYSGCTLKELRYEESSYSGLLIQEYNDDMESAIVIRGDFKVGAFGANAAFTPGTDIDGCWSWTLVKKSDGRWVIVNHGQG